MILRLLNFGCQKSDYYVHNRIKTFSGFTYCLFQENENKIQIVERIFKLMRKGRRVVIEKRLLRIFLGSEDCLYCDITQYITKQGKYA
jgi:hypothetical protein